LTDDCFKGGEPFPPIVQTVLIRQLSRRAGRRGEMTIIGFYSYKGGTGRTTTLANVAVLLAQEGSHVACLDLDITAPGLDLVFRIQPDMLQNKQFILNNIVAGESTSYKNCYFDFCDELLANQNRGSFSGKLYIFPAPRLPRRTGRTRDLDSIIPAVSKYAKLGDFSRLARSLKANLLLDTRGGFCKENRPLFNICDKILIFTRFTNSHILSLEESFLPWLEGIIANQRNHLKRQQSYFIVINGLPPDLPGDAKQRLDCFKKKYDVVIVPESRELTWEERLIVLDNLDSKPAKYRGEFEQLLAAYREIINKLK